MPVPIVSLYPSVPVDASVCTFMLVCVTSCPLSCLVSSSPFYCSVVPCLFACCLFSLFFLSRPRVRRVPPCLSRLLVTGDRPPLLSWPGGRGSGRLDGHRAHGWRHFNRHDHHDVLPVAHDRHLLGRDVGVRMAYLVPGTAVEATAVGQY